MCYISKASLSLMFGLAIFITLANVDCGPEGVPIYSPAPQPPQPVERCGDGKIQSHLGETCEGTNFQGHTCQTHGYTGGLLACSASCKTDASGCQGQSAPAAQPRCGNGVREGGEQCDGADLGGQTCFSRGGYAHRPISCGPNCLIDDSRCFTVAGHLH